MPQLVNSSFQISTNVALRNIGSKKGRLKKRCGYLELCSKTRNDSQHYKSRGGVVYGDQELGTVEMVRRSGIGDDILTPKTEN